MRAAPSAIDHGIGLSAIPFRALRAASAAPCSSAPSSRDSAMHSELVTIRSTSMVRIAGPAAAAPSSATSSGTPMKPVLGNAATSAPNAASFQRMRAFMLVRTTSATTASAQARYTTSADMSSNWPTGVRAPNVNNIAGSAKYSTKEFSPEMASSGSMRRRAAT